MGNDTTLTVLHEAYADAHLTSERRGEVAVQQPLESVRIGGRRRRKPRQSGEARRFRNFDDEWSDQTGGGMHQKNRNSKRVSQGSRLRQ